MEKFKEKFKDFLKMKYAKDALILGALVLVYSIISFINLGSTSCPQTYCIFENGDEYVFELDEVTNISKIRMFIGDLEGKFNVYGSKDGNTYYELFDFENSVLTWQDFKINTSAKYIKISASKDGNIGEMQVYDNLDNKVKAYTSYNYAKTIIDEPETVPDEIGYMNSAYFDEVYFATSAYEYANGYPATEWTHPHLGKILQTIPIKLFGFSPFTYRLTNNISGIGMVIVMYLLGKLLFKKKRYSFLAAFLMVFVNFHFAQTRIGTVDGTLALFNMLSVFFMCRYFLLDSKADLKKKLINLFSSGVFIGFAIAVKWTSFYTGLGLAILFFSKLIYDSIKNKKFGKQEIITILSCVVFFVIIPIIIYLTVYFNFQTVYGEVKNLSQFFKITGDMYNFHSTLDASHPFSSQWYSWPIMYKPVWFFVSTLSNGLVSTIVGIGNPAIWWFGIIAMIFTISMVFIKRSKESIFITIMFLAVWAPFIWIGRVMFLYHYFPALIYIMLAITYFISCITEKLKLKWPMIAYMIIVLILFGMFYPVVSGMPITNEYRESVKWFESWYF